MAECVYRRQGQSFKSFLDIIANPGDTVTITATDSRGIPEEYQQPFVMNDSGKLTVVVKKKGDYTVSATESGIAVTVSITQRRTNNEADVSFINTVTVNANPNATITMSNYGEVTRSYSGIADANGVATVTVKRKGTYHIETSTSSSDTELSKSPESVDTFECVTNGATPTINHVRVTVPSAYAAGPYSVASGQFYAYMERYNSTAATGYRIQTKAGSAPSSLTDGTTVGDDGFGTSRTLKNGVTKESFIGTGTVGSTYYFLGAVYVTINDIRYYGSEKSWNFTFKDSRVTNKAFTASGSYTVPDGCRTLAFAVVGGGGGGSGNSGTSWQAGGGGGGGRMTRGTWSVTPGQIIYFTIGGGGSGGTSVYGGNGGQSKISVGSLSATANGGDGAGYTAGKRYNHYALNMGGHGGSGGGRGAGYASSGDPYTSGQAGGNDGCAGGKTNTSTNPATADSTWVGYSTSTKWSSGNGQGKWENNTWIGTTYNGITYAGGGGGGEGGNASLGRHAGGSGGGYGGNAKLYYTYTDANGNTKKVYYYDGASGTSGTGGGGGGSSENDDCDYSGGYGGSGCVIISLS